MNKFILIGVTIAALASARAQDAASTPAASPNLENLRQQLQALTETVKALQQQVKDQQVAIEKANGNAGSPPQIHQLRVRARPRVFKPRTRPWSHRQPRRLLRPAPA